MKPAPTHAALLPVALAVLLAAPAAPLPSLVAPLSAQQERGDIDLQFNGSVLTVVGQEGATFTSAIFHAKGGYFVTDHVEIGAFPSLMIQRTGAGEAWAGETQTESKLGMGVFATYSFLAEDAATVPYLGVQGYRIDLTDEDETGWIGANGGLKFYFNPSVAFDVGANYLVGLGDRGGALILFQMGLGFLL